MTGALLRHLLEATVVTGIAWLVVTGFARAGAASRYTAWLVAMLKFALPTAILADLGARAGTVLPISEMQPAWMPDLSALWRAGGVAVVRTSAQRVELETVLLAVWLTGAAIFLALTLRRLGAARPGAVRDPNESEKAAMQRACSRIGERAGLEIGSSDRAPGLVGMFKPTVVLPDGLSEALEAQELEAVLMHELAHARRRDNAAALVSRIVCSVFWFYPLVWWLERRLLAERERACDELVPARGVPVERYVGAILKSCRFSVAGAEAGAASAAGSDLKKRMEQIMSHAISPRHQHACRAAVGLTAAALVVIPFGAGVLGRSARAQTIARRDGIEFISATLMPGKGKTSAHTELLKAVTDLVNPFAPQVVPTRDPWQKWLQEVAVYLITPEERAAFLRLTTNEERDKFIEQFWKRRDPTPGTSENEFKTEHYRRIAWANEQFGGPGLPGRQTDRGRIYIVMGPPDEREEHPGSNEQWLYRNIDDSTDGLIVTFKLR